MVATTGGAALAVRLMLNRESRPDRWRRFFFSEFGVDGRDGRTEEDA